MRMMIDKAMPFIPMILGARIIDMLIAREDKGVIFQTVVLMVGSTMLLKIARCIISLKVNDYYTVINDRNKRNIGYKAMTMDYEVLERNSTLELIEKANSNADKMGGWGNYFERILNLFGSILSCVGAMVAMFNLMFDLNQGGQGAGYGFFASPLSYVILLLLLTISIYVKSKCESKQEKAQYECDQIEVQNGRVYWFFHNLVYDYPLGKDIRIFHMSDLIIEKGMKAWKEIEKAFRDIIQRTLRIGLISCFAQNVFLASIYIFVGVKAIYGMITIGEVTRYISAITLLQSQIGLVFTLLIDMNTHHTYLESFDELMAVQNEKYDGTLPVEKRLDHEYQIEFRNVSFHYPNNDRMILKKINFKLDCGSKLAIVGPNGAGKTTFIKLLCRLYDPTEGEILLNGIDIRKYDFDEYIRLFSVVFQDYKIFSFSVAENVAAGPDYDEEQVIQSLKEAGIYDRVLAMKNGLQSKLLKDQQDNDEEGIEISGGEKQKIALARALYRDAPMVILDEPTSALDPMAEQDIYTRFNSMVEEKTAIFISHRMSSCRFCNQIVVFKDGEIAECGTHEELISNSDGLYSSMWEAQAQYYV